MKKVAIYVEHGGMGDVQMALNCVKSFKHLRPKTHITFLCDKYLLPLAYNNPNIDECIAFYPEFKELNFDKIYNLSDDVCLEYELKTNPVKKTRMEIFAEVLKIPKISINPEVYLSKDEKESIPHLMDINKIDKNKFKIGVITRAGSYSRIYSRYEELEDLISENSQIIVFKGKSIDWSDTEWSKNTRIIEGKSLRELISLLSVCDIVIGNDTGPMHIASSLNIPTLWLFSHIDGNMRVKEYRNANFIQGICGFSPCWYKIKCIVNNNPNTPPCLDNIEPKEIIEKIKTIHNKYKKELICGD